MTKEGSNICHTMKAKWMGRSSFRESHPERSRLTPLFFICIEIYHFCPVSICCWEEENSLNSIFFTFEYILRCDPITTIFTGSTIGIWEPWDEPRGEEEELFSRMTSLEMGHLMCDDKLYFLFIIFTSLEDTRRYDDEVSRKKMSRKCIEHTVHIVEVDSWHWWHPEFFRGDFRKFIDLRKLFRGYFYPVTLDVWEKYRMSKNDKYSEKKCIGEENTKGSYPEKHRNYKRNFSIDFFFWVDRFEIFGIIQYRIFHKGV